jgi:hypothetical protein
MEGQHRMEGEVEVAWLRTGRRRSARRQPTRWAAAAQASDGRRRRTSGPSWARVARWAECHLGQRGGKTKKREMGRKDNWAEMIFGLR